MSEETRTAPSKNSAKVDVMTFAGFALALAGILGGLLLEGGKLKDIAQFTAAMIVLGGTAGAVMVSTPVTVLHGAVRRFAGVFRGNTASTEALITQVIGYAAKARKNGLVSLEQVADTVDDPFLKKALNLAVDGTDLQDIRKILDLDIEVEAELGEAEAKVFESAGGYAPTIGIIGAVLGLIQVMKNLANIDEVGHGIAVAFVATVYGVGAANLLFLPAASKIKARIAAEVQRKELIVEAISGIVEGLNPKLIRMKLETYAQPPPAKKSSKALAREAGANAPAGQEA